MVRFEVHIKGGDGQNYYLYWNDNPVYYVGQGNVAMIQFGWLYGDIYGTVKVVSGDQEAEAKASGEKSKLCH